MFCEKCGTKNDDDAAFCEKCGAKLMSNEDAAITKVTATNQQINSKPVEEILYSNSQPMQKVKKPKKPMSLGAKISIIAGSAVVVLLAAFLIVGSIITNPEKLVKKYFEATESSDYSTAYDCLDIQDQGLTSKSNYENVMKANNSKEEITNLNIKEEKSSSENLKFNKVYTVTYISKGNSEERTMTVTLVKQKEKKLLFFDSYKVSPDNLLVKDLNITVPKGAELTVDGNTIPASDVANDENSTTPTVNYLITNIFSGNHDISVTAPFMNSIKETADLEDGNNLDYSEFELSDDAVSDITDLGHTTLTEYYDDILAKKDFNEISSLFEDSDSDELSESQYRYNSMLETISYYLEDENVTIGKITETSCNLGNSESDISAVAQFDIDYSYTSTNMYEYTGESTFNSTVYFTFKDGSWKITEVD